MKFETSNKYTVYFKDGTSIESAGSSSSIEKSSIKDEFDWLGFHIQKEVHMVDKSLNDIVKVECKIEYNL